ncbi:hypothetical protein F5X68DRAFT_255531 [Plectosphaerella plurivora]|uniref:Uncharacterized protein n=1 Tax=Plectosphaerella plurivora TaxID=936078 RepID=A0A9P9ABB3_9PEZI|nr:hypothetical protein F5X68DRAFT_255531 [Plectosphaerella plurivora]
MKFFVALLSLASVVMAAPVSEGPATSLSGSVLPRGWTRIDPSEVARRMASFALDNKGGLEKRQPGNVYLCTKANWQGDCAVVDFTVAYTCQAIPAPFTNNLGSIGPDKGALCRLTTHADARCGSVSKPDTCDLHGDLFIEYPGFDNLFSHEGQDYGSKAHHITCQKCTACQGEGVGLMT